jgi:hypothetical protein
LAARMRETRMKFERKIVLLLGCMVLPNMFGAAALFVYIHTHPGELVPRWVSVPMLCLFILTIVGGSIALTRTARKQAKIETPEESKLRRSRATKGLKAGLVLWGLILLNGIRLVVQHEVPWIYAVPGLTVDVLLIVVFWISLKRLRKFEATTAETGQQHP